MNLLQDILARLPGREIPVRRLLVGAHWTMVCSRFCGLGATLSCEGPHSSVRSRVRDVGKLHLKTANELAQWVLSDNLLEASIGMAALNSLLEVDETQAVEINAAELIAKHGKGKNIAVIGHFPFVERLKPLARNFWVLEKRPAEGDYPAESATDLLPQADVIAITGTTLINHTLEDLLKLRPPQALVMLIGPSTPLTPILFAYGVDIISGARVLDEEATWLTIQQGAVFQQVQGTRLISFAQDSDILKPNR